VDAAALVSAILSSPAPVLVDFSAARHGSTALERVARARAGEIVVLHVNPGEEPAAAEAYSIQTTPTLVLFSGGAEVARRTGIPEAAELRAWLEAARAVPALR
jgi:thioredoxin 2